METRAHYVAVGTFVLAMVFLAFVGVIYLGGIQLTTQFARYDIYFKGAVTGLSKGAVVDYNGIPVGKVYDVEIDPQDVEQIRVTVEIETKVVIKTDAKAQVESNILSGVSYILISKGTNEAPPLVAKAGERYPVIQVRRSTLASISARAPELLDKLDAIEDRVEKLLDDHNLQAMSDILDNVRTISGDFAAHDKDLVEAITSANKMFSAAAKFVDNLDDSYMAQDGMKDRLSRMLAAVAKTATGLDDTSREIRLTVHDVHTAVNTVNSKTLLEVNDLLHEARLFVAGLTRLGEQIERDPSKLLYGDRREGYRPK